LNARLLDAPYRRSSCRRYLAGTPRSRRHFTPLPMAHRIALTRTALRYRCLQPAPAEHYKVPTLLSFFPIH
jgi:hypothetical protein